MLVSIDESKKKAVVGLFHMSDRPNTLPISILHKVLYSLNDWIGDRHVCNNKRGNCGFLFFQK